MISPNKYLEWFCVICGFIVLLVWPLPHTIALRNNALCFGALFSLIWIYRNWNVVNKQFLKTTLLLLCVPLWVGFQYCFIAVNKSLAWQDLSGTWLRVFLAVLLGGGLGLIIRQQSSWPRMLLLPFTLFPLAVFLEYPYLISKGIGLMQQYQEYPSIFFKYKSAAVYFLGWSGLIAYAILDFNLSTTSARSSYRWLSLFALFLIVVCMIDFIAFRSLNGVLLILFSGFILLFKLVIILSKKQGERKNFYIALLIFTVLLTVLTFAYWKYDSQADGKMKNLATDIAASWDINKSEYWQLTNAPNKDNLIQDASGRQVSQSTYLRVSWFRYGFGLLTQNPLGVGYTHAAFDYYMQKNFPGSSAKPPSKGTAPSKPLDWLAKKYARPDKSSIPSASTTYLGQDAIKMLLP